VVRRAVVWTFAGQGASFVFSFASSVIVARLLSPYELGIFAVAMAVLGVLQVIATFGVGLWVVREAELTPAMMDTAYTVNALLALALAALVAAAAVPAAWFLHEPAVTRVLLALAATPLLGIPAFRPTAMLQREMRFGPLSFLGALNTATTAAVTVAAAMGGASYMSPAYGSVAAGLVGAVAAVAVAPRHARFGMSLAGWRPMVKFGVQVMSVSGLAMAAVKASDLLLGRLIGLASLGLLARAGNLSTMINTYVYSTATRVVYAQLAKDYRERGVVRDTFVPGLRMIAGVVGPAVIGMAFLSRPLIELLYGPKWAGAAPVLSFLLLAQFLSLSFAMNWEVYLVRNQLAIQVKFEAARSVFGLLSKAVASFGGLIAVAASTVVDQLFSMILYLPRMGKLTDTGNRELAGIWGEAALLALVTGTPSLALMMWHGWSAQVPLLQVAGAVAAGGALWLMLLARLQHPLWREIRHLVALGTARLRARAGGEDARC
jgi:O-antigen/teichoic acid export membrane protein